VNDCEFSCKIREFKSPFNRTDNFEGSIVAPGVAETFIRTYQEKKKIKKEKENLLSISKVTK